MGDLGPTVSSFPPLLADSPQLLILGSMPGVASLQAQQYYAHPRNAFWPIMSQLLGFDAARPYAERCQQATDAGIAIWDVLKECQREGSLDTAIDRQSEVANDFASLLSTYPTIRRIYFNGAKAETSFRRHVLGQLPEERVKTLRLTRLPSTSPAHAGMSFEAKLQAWRVFLTS